MNFKPAGMNPYTGVVYNYVPKPGAEEQIYQKIADISVSMKAKDYLHMPECLTVEHQVEMDPEEKSLYERMKQDLFLQVANSDEAANCERNKGTVFPVPCTAGTEELSPKSRPNFSEVLTIDAGNAASLSGKLLQMANGAVYTDEREVAPIHTRKLDALVDAKREIREVIDCVEDVTLRLILEKRHLLFQPWEEIAIDLGITSRWAKDRHKEALKAVEQILEAETV